jgi:hypothetical protein
VSALDVGEGQHGEAGEALRRRSHEVGGALVDEPRELVGQVLVAEEHARRRERHHSRVDRVARHELVHEVRRPRWQRQRRQ